MNLEEALLGTWRTDSSDESSLAEYGDVSMHFEPTGALTYTVHGAISVQILNLTYRVDGTVMITDQPSKPREERTKFAFAPDGRLLFWNADETRAAYFQRQ